MDRKITQIMTRVFQSTSDDSSKNLYEQKKELENFEQDLRELEAKIKFCYGNNSAKTKR